MKFYRGEIYLADLSQVIGSEQGGIRPVLIIQNNIGNKYSPTLIVACITSKDTKAKVPTHVMIEASGDGLLKDSRIMLEQIRTIDKTRIQKRLGKISSNDMKLVNQSLQKSVGI